MKLTSFLCLFFIANASTAFADSFAFSCTDKRTVGFRDESSAFYGWGDENFNSTWSIRYDGVSEVAFIDDKPVTIIKGNGTVILVDYSENQNSQSLWAWAIHIPERKITASQVNVYDFLGVGVKSRSVEFNCS